MLLQLRDVPFEQDVRELFVVFSLEQSFSRVPEQDVMISCIITAEAEAGNKEAGRLGTHHAILLMGRGERLSFESPWFSERLTSKGELGRVLYRTLSAFTGKELPWGTLTGIHSAELALSLLQWDKTVEEICTEFKHDLFLNNARNTLYMRTAENELRAIQGLNFATGYSLHIGIPFCPTTCLYCSLLSYPTGENKAAPYLAALREELRLTAEMMAGRRLDTVYVDGGTPISLTAKGLRLLLLFVCKTSGFSACQELMVEAGRPDSIIREKLLALREAGIGQISINPQTLEQATLDLVGRFHMVEQFTESFALARELGLDNVSTDLTMGLSNETEVDARRTMEGICALSPDDAIIHSLTLERAARLNMKYEDYRDVRYGGANQMVELAASYCEKMGLSPYCLHRWKNTAGNLEGVGWCRLGKEGLYNILIIEELEATVGCGAGTTACVMRGGEQYDHFRNVKDPALYVKRLPELLAEKQRALAGDALE